MTAGSEGVVKRDRQAQTADDGIGVAADCPVQDGAALILQQPLPGLGQVHLRDENDNPVVAVFGGNRA